MAVLRHGNTHYKCFLGGCSLIIQRSRHVVGINVPRAALRYETQGPFELLLEAVLRDGGAARLPHLRQPDARALHHGRGAGGGGRHVDLGAEQGVRALPLLALLARLAEGLAQVLLAVGAREPTDSLDVLARREVLFSLPYAHLLAFSVVVPGDEEGRFGVAARLRVVLALVGEVVAVHGQVRRGFRVESQLADVLPRGRSRLGVVDRGGCVVGRDCLVGVGLRGAVLVVLKPKGKWRKKYLATLKLCLIYLHGIYIKMTG